MTRPASIASTRLSSSSRVLFALLLMLVGCQSVESAARKDPMKCERDPKCAGHADKSQDCVTACVDDPACIDRCRQVTGQR